jgi:uncharacterized membrane protein YphA (DoxX/SURF4 family)
MRPDRPVKGPERPVKDRGVKPRRDAPLPRTRPSSILPILARWLEGPEPVLRLEIIRVVAPLAVLGFMSSRLAHVDEWLTSAGFQVPPMSVPDYRQPFYLPPLSSTSAWLLAIAMVLSGLAVAVGFRARAAALVFAATLAYVALADRLAAFTVSKLAPAVMLALAASPCGARFGVDAWLARRASPDAPLPRWVAGGGPRFFQVLLPAFYCGSAIAKGFDTSSARLARGDWLKDPLVLWSHVHDSYQTGFSFLLADAMPAWAWTALQAVVLALELGAPLWFAMKRTRPWALALAVQMHVMIGLMFWPVRWFALLMIALWLGAYLPEAWLERAAARSTRM